MVFPRPDPSDHPTLTLDITEANPVPEPSGFVLFSSGVVALLIWWTRKSATRNRRASGSG